MSQAIPPSGSGRATTVLLVEDESLIRMNLGDYLQDKGFGVIEAANAAQAISALSNPTLRIDLVFSDVRMPGEMDGFALANWLRQYRTELPVILTSGDIGQAHGARQACPRQMFLAKPYQLQAVAAKIADVVGGGNA